MSKFKTTVLAVLAVIILIGLFIGVEYGGLAWKKHFKPKHESVNRDVFTQTKSYVDGMAQEAVKIYGEYQTASDADKPILANVVRVKFAEFDYNKLRNETVRRWLDDIMNYRIP